MQSAIRYQPAGFSPKETPFGSSHGAQRLQQSIRESSKEGKGEQTARL